VWNALKLLLTKSTVIRKRYNQQLTPAIIQRGNRDFGRFNNQSIDQHRSQIIRNMPGPQSESPTGRWGSLTRRHSIYW
jgi:hypothetical protein